MDFNEMRASARAVRQGYAAMEVRQFGRTWTPEEVMLGFLGDVGDLAKLVQGKAGIRPTLDLDKKVAHELADCLWSVMTLADLYGVDLEQSFSDTMRALSDHPRAEVEQETP
jgi:NTP pyrophosphatase (non-canonical NTP hydrolase)